MTDDIGSVTQTRDGHVLIITVDRATKMNGFTPEMFEGMIAGLETLEADADLWAGVVCFAGDHTTAGLDMPRFFGAEASERSVDPNRLDAFGLNRRCSKPVIMAVQGVTYTIGIEMLLGVDIVVAAEDCRFRQLEPRRGLAVFGGAHVRFVQRAGWGNAMYHLLRADEFDAMRALELGFVQEVVPAGEQRTRAIELAQQICECAPIAVQEIKRAAFVYLTEGERAAFAEIPTMRERTLGSADAAEGIASFRERREARFTGK
ncbi:MAG: crotonase/enoyl-CoA hydratase family protein [Pseudomonadota bacterium]